MENSSKVSEIKGRAVPVRGADMDTDRIIPARFLRTITFDDLGEHVFEDDRAAGGHSFDDARFQGASILVANQNFGCGSSREHAPQALMRWGIKAFVGESFAEIFFGNCVALGLPCFIASAADVSQLMDAVEADPAQELVLDVAAQTIRGAGDTIQAALADGPRGQFLDGAWDALGQLLEADEQVGATARRLPYISSFASP
jgi:3-isopropylmalate/(R)-2-methylmalate dehydratase small subunit